MPTALVFEPRISRQEREDIIIDWFNQWLQQALHQFTQEELRTTMESSFQISRFRWMPYEWITLWQSMKP